jgi:hypothetical protein
VGVVNEDVRKGEKGGGPSCVHMRALVSLCHGGQGGCGQCRCEKREKGGDPSCVHMRVAV